MTSRGSELGPRFAVGSTAEADGLGRDESSVLQKPFSIAELLAAIEKLVANGGS